MKRWTYYFYDLEFEMPVDDGYETFYADGTVFACSYLYGDDADGNRGIYVTEREADVEAVRNEAGEDIQITDAMREEIQTKINEKGADLE
jgi:hypothetical protein